MNAIFPDEPTDAPHPNDGYLLPRSSRRLEPSGEANAAVELIRSKIDALYGTEPNARKELQEAEATRPRSKHQQFMHELSSGGKSLAEIQSAWHAYYIKLSDDDKRQVWQEFYAANARTPSSSTRIAQQRSAALRAHVASEVPQPLPQIKTVESGLPTQPYVHVSEHATPVRPTDRRSAATIKKQVLHKVRMSNAAQLKAKQHLQSLAFGLGLGALVVLVFLFSFFNQVILTPFIQPNNHASATPIILAQGSLAPSSNPEVIIPKTNVELPVIYGTSTSENDVENSLEDGVVHYASTSVPGQQGNAAFFGHSSNNIFNPGKYKFAFVLLHTLVPGDIFYLTYNGKVYTYRVFQKQVVEPSEVWVLNPVEGKAATATLITCDPPGTSLHRLVVWGEQIDPDPNANNGAPAPSQVAQAPSELASNGPSLWSRVWGWATFWN